MTRGVRIVGLAGALLSLLIGIGPAQAVDTVLKIGFVGPYSGASAEYTEAGRRAAEVITNLLTPKARVHRVDLPNRVQPDQLSSAEINVLVDPDLLTESPLPVMMGYPACLYDPVSYPNRTAVSPAWSPNSERI